MRTLVFNCGSSSLNFKVFEARAGQRQEVVFRGKAHRVGVKGSEPSFIEFHGPGRDEEEVASLPAHREAAARVFSRLREWEISFDAIGHRFVHGGGRFARSAILDTKAREELERCLGLAPIHNPISMSVIEEATASCPHLPQYATFDTAFHSTLPPETYTYALPRELRERFGFRKFGFHGLSYAYVTRAALEYLELEGKPSRLAACHLGTGGSSVAAIRDGRSVDTSMGFSPLAGLVMSTRSGDLDPMLLLYLMASHGLRPEELENLLNKKSGLIGLSSFSSDLRDIIRRIHDEDEQQAGLAFSMYCHRLRKFVGAYIALLGGVDAVVFTDDIGVTNAAVRSRVCEGLGWAGIALDEDANNAAPHDSIGDIGAADAAVRVLTIPTDEERVIAWEGARLLGKGEETSP